MKGARLPIMGCWRGIVEGRRGLGGCEVECSLVVGSVSVGQAG
jgi:hypothetical protein